MPDDRNYALEKKDDNWNEKSSRNGVNDRVNAHRAESPESRLGVKRDLCTAAFL